MPLVFIIYIYIYWALYILSYPHCTMFRAVNSSKYLVNLLHVAPVADAADCSDIGLSWCHAGSYSATSGKPHSHNFASLREILSTQVCYFLLSTLPLLNSSRSESFASILISYVGAGSSICTVCSEGTFSTSIGVCAHQSVEIMTKLSRSRIALFGKITPPFWWRERAGSLPCRSSCRV